MREIDIYDIYVYMYICDISYISHVSPYTHIYHVCVCNVYKTIPFASPT